MEIGGVAAAADGDGHRPREDTHSSVVVTLTLSLKSNLNMKSCTNAAEPNLTSVFTLFRRSGSDSHRLTDSQSFSFTFTSFMIDLGEK